MFGAILRFFAPPPPPPPPALFDDVTIGVALACLAAAMAAIGVNLQRLGKQRGLPAISVLGVFLATSCGAADMASFQYAPQSLLAPFASLGLVVNLALAPIHGEKIAALDGFCTLLVVAGVAACLSSASTEQPPRTPDELAALATRPAFLMWVAVEAAVLGAAALRATTGAAQSTLTAIGYAVRAGVFGGCTVLCAKVLTECMRAGAPTSSVLVVGGCAGLFALSQVVCLNAAVGRYSSLLIVPIFTATSLATNASGGGIFFEEFAAFTAEQRRTYLLGVALLLSGVSLIASKAGSSGSMQPGDAAAKAKKKK